MTKMEFLAKIRSGLGSLPADEIQKTHEFYREMIDDMIEDGLTEEEAVAAVGDANEIIKNILSDSTTEKQSKKTETEPPIISEKKKGSSPGTKALIILLLILGSPLWITLLLAAASVVLAVAVTVLSVIITVFAVFLSIIITLYATVLALAVSAAVLFVLSIFGGFTPRLIMLGASLILAGITVLLFLVSNLVTKSLFFISKGIFNGIKFLFTRRKKA